MSKQKLHIIANNHIDREWTYDAQLTRLITVKFFEDLIETFEKIPDFQFVLDSQTVPLEDFLELFPEKAEVLKKYVKEKRLWVGPWYTAPDSFYLNGESIVRNMLVGHEVAEKFGNVSKFGYTPFGWGQVSQLPQIYNGFGIDSIFFYRGADTINSSFYKWAGADGTKAYCIKYPRTNFFDKVFRPMTKDRDAVPWDRELDYVSNEVPFMFSSDEFKYEHGFVAGGKYHVKGDKIEETINNFIQSETGKLPGDAILGMNGMDTCFPSLTGLLAINKVKNENKCDCEIIYSSLDQFSLELKEAVKGNNADLEIHSGEMRRFLPGFGGPGKSEAKSTHFYLASARPRQKSKNAKAENVLARYAEPFAAVSHTLGKVYPKEFFDYAWKYLLKCHPHDTIAGCGVDQIEIDMMNRLDQTINTSKAVLNMSAQFIVSNIDNKDIKDDEIALVVFNPSPFMRNDIISLWLHLPQNMGFADFEIIDKKTGKSVEFEIIKRGEMEDRIFRDLTDTSLFTYGELVKLNLNATVDGLGYKTLVIKKAAPKLSGAEMISKVHNSMENEYLAVEINDDGTFNITEKNNGKTYSNLHFFTDTGDNGDPWVRFVPDKNVVHSSKNQKAQIELVQNSSLVAGYKIQYQMMIPKGLKKSNYIMEGYFDSAESSEELVPLKITSTVTLSKNSKYLDVNTEIDNQSTDHLVQVVFPTGLKADSVYAESAFDVVERKIVKNEKNIDPSLVNGEDPFIRFIDMTDNKNGLAVLSDSVKGYEVLGDSENSMVLNLIRSYTSQIVTIYGRKERRPDQPLTQAQGIHKFHYAIYPHTGNWENGCIEQAEKVNYPLMPVQTHRSFGTLPSEVSFIKASPEVIAISALKKANKDEGIILRLYNPSENAVESNVELFKDLKRIETVNLNEESIDTENSIEVKGNKFKTIIGAKKIASFKLYFQE